MQTQPSAVQTLFPNCELTVEDASELEEIEIQPPIEDSAIEFCEVAESYIETLGYETFIVTDEATPYIKARPL